MSRLTPVQVTGLSGVAAVDAGVYHTVAVTGNSLPAPSVELTLERTYAGTASQTVFRPGDAVTVKLQAANNGSGTFVATTLNVFDSTFLYPATEASRIYDSHDPQVNEDVTGYLAHGETGVYGFTFTLPADAAPGQYHIGAAIRRQPWGAVLDTTGPGMNPDDWTEVAYIGAFEVRHPQPEPRQYAVAPPDNIPDLSRLAKWVPNGNGGTWQQIQVTDPQITSGNVHVLVHGWGRGRKDWVDAVANQGGTARVWDSGNAAWFGPFTEMAKAIALRDQGATVLAYSWIDYSATADDYRLAKLSRGLADRAGLFLCIALVDALATDFAGKLHFIGHSHGSRVAAAAAVDLENRHGRRVNHLTFLESPDNGWPRMAGAENNLPDLLEQLTIARTGDATFVDNYPAHPGTGTCYGTEGGVLREVVDVVLLPNVPLSDVGGGHGYPIEWYTKATRDTTDRGLFWSPTDRHYYQDWRTADGGVNASQELVLKSGSGTIGTAAKLKRSLVVSAYNTEGQVSETEGHAMLTESSTDSFMALLLGPLFEEPTASSGSAYWDAVLNVSAGDEVLEFEYQFLSAGDGDELGVWIDGERRFVISGNVAGNGLRFSSISIGNLTPGKHSMTIALHSYGLANAEVEVGNYKMLATGPKITEWVMLASHGEAGQLAVVAQDGYVEPRAGRPRALRLTFSYPISPSGLTTGAVSIAGTVSGDCSQLVQSLTPSADGLVLTVELSQPLPDADVYVITLSDQVTDGRGLPVSGGRQLSLGVLEGDEDGSGSVTAADILAIRSHAGLPPFSGPEGVRVRAVVWPCAAEGEA
jgi:hypothetical protein